MFVLFHDEPRDRLTLYEIRGEKAVAYYNSELHLNVDDAVKRYEEDEEGKERFDDIVDALDSTNVSVYRMTEPVGY